MVNVFGFLNNSYAIFYDENHCCFGPIIMDLDQHQAPAKAYRFLLWFDAKYHCSIQGISNEQLLKHYNDFITEIR